MGQERLIVLGAGISGLTLAFFLRKYCPNAEVIILEKSSHVGGLISAEYYDGLVLDQGPKTFRASHGKVLLDLIEEVGLKDDLLFSSKQASKRYIYHKNKLEPVPFNLHSFVKSPFRSMFIKGIWKDLFTKKRGVEDETIASFIQRRFGDTIAKTFIAPFVIGLCGGSIESLSVKSYFPFLKEAEEGYGSVIKALIKRKKSKKRTKKNTPALFNLRGGGVRLTNRLREMLHDALRYREEVKEIRKNRDHIEVITESGSIYRGDHIFCTLPAAAMKKLDLDPQVNAFFAGLKMGSIVSVSLAFDKRFSSVEGFGYLVPPEAKQNILGVIFDSSIFPELDEAKYPTKVTVMLGGCTHPEMLQKSKEELVHIALKALSDHLQIQEAPSISSVFFYQDAIPQYPPYHTSQVEDVKKYIDKTLPYLTLGGYYLNQLGVIGCVTQAEALARAYGGIK